MKKRVFAVSMLSTLVLAACGGSGGGGSSTGPIGSNPTPTNPTPTNPTTPTTPTPDPTALQTSVAAATYPAGSTALSAFTTLNAARQVYGVGLLAQNAKIDVAANNHAKYVTGRWVAKDFANAAHIEDPFKPGFTGIGYADRISFAGYAAATSGEIQTSFISVDGVTSDAGVVAINTLLSGPYHRMAAFDSHRDVGIADSTVRIEGEGGVNHAVVVNMATAHGAQGQAPATSWIGMWPAADATNVMYSLAGESPDPIPINKGACAGYPVSFQVHPSLQLAATTFTLVETGSGAPVSVQLSTPSTDVNPMYARGNVAYIIPFKPLKLNTKYTARFVGTAGSTAIDRTWSFTTTAQNTKMIYGCDPS